MKRLLAGLFIMTLAAGCSESSSTSGDEDDDSPEAVIANVDKHCDEIMASTTKGEAREWMKGPKHVFFKTDPKQVAQFVEDFYNAGAQQVLIGDIEEEEGGSQYGEALLVVLPKDAAARAKLFEVDTRADAAFEDDVVSDKGQKYLYHSLD